MTPNRPSFTTPLLRNIQDIEEKLRKAEEELAREIDELHRAKQYGTVVFFDLKGSTKYRRRFGLEMGLHKAYLHNSTVSAALIAAGGQVAKWLGDGVLGYFTESGGQHAFAALRAALAALADIHSLNDREPLKRISRVATQTGYDRVDHEIHTKVAICTGELHFFDLAVVHGPSHPDRTESGPYPLDPMGSCVDLAARLSDLAEADTILIDRLTFWGAGARQGGVTKLGDSVCPVREDEIPWRPLHTDRVRETVYIPSVCAFLIGPDGLHPCRTAQSGTNTIGAEELVSFAVRDREAAGLPDRPIVYVQRQIPCNVASFDLPIEVLAATLHPHHSPIGNGIHESDNQKTQALLEEAERHYRSGRNREVVRGKYEAVLAADPLDFQSNVRLAMLARADNDSERALRYLLAAKQSDPTSPLAWAVSGMIHLDDYLHDRNIGDALVRAITGFTRAKVLAARGFHGLLEQYSTALLAIAQLFTPGDSAALAGKLLIDELANWPPKNATSRYAIRLAEVLHKFRFRDPNAQADVDRLRAEIDGNQQLQHEALEMIPYDHVIRFTDVKNLLERAAYLATTD